jgi:hypothetical protein
LFVSSIPLLLVALDDICGTHSAEARIKSGFAAGPALPQQVPALVETNLEIAQSTLVVLAQGLAGCGFGLEVMLLFDQLVDLCDEVFIHCDTVGRAPRTSR